MFMDFSHRLLFDKENSILEIRSVPFLKSTGAQKNLYIVYVSQEQLFSITVQTVSLN
jgi:hypothetical protein